MKFKQTLKIFEEEIFKAASSDEAFKRKQDYALIKINKILKDRGTQNPDGSWDVEGDVRISDLGLTKIPIKFNKVTGSFDCSCNQLTSLEGCPKEVNRNFDCYYNNLTSLEGCPEIVGGNFYCSCNNLTSLKGCPKEVNGNFNCSYNELTSLKDCPKIVDGGFYCTDNKVQFTKNDVKAHSIVNRFIYII